MIFTLKTKTLTSMFNEFTKLCKATNKFSIRECFGCVFFSSECIGITDGSAIVWIAEHRHDVNVYNDSEFYFIDNDFLREFLKTAKSEIVIDTENKTINGIEMKLKGVHMSRSMNMIISNTAKNPPSLQLVNWKYIDAGFKVLKTMTPVTIPECVGVSDIGAMRFMHDCGDLQFNMLIAKVIY